MITNLRDEPEQPLFQIGKSVFIDFSNYESHPYRKMVITKFSEEANLFRLPKYSKFIYVQERNKILKRIVRVLNAHGIKSTIENSLIKISDESVFYLSLIK